MKTSDGREVVGVAKESQKAEDEYRQALEEYKVAGLVQWGADDGAYHDLNVFIDLSLTSMGWIQCSLYL